MNSFELMYETFGVHSRSAKSNGCQNIALSTGINWLDSNKFILKLLKMELESGLSHKSYGRSIGFKFVTDLISEIEMDISKTSYKPSCVITNGTADASHLIFSFLKETKYFKETDKALMINHGFPFYNNLSDAFDLDFCECILPKNILALNKSFLAPISDVINEIHRMKPKIVFLIVPNNPLGEEYGKEDLQKLNKCIEELHIKLVIDRVCLMPWNNYSKYNEVFIDSIEAGNIFIVDSFSKGESVGGLRIGYLLTNKENEEVFLKMIRCRCLNPRAFGTLAMAISRVFSHTFYSSTDLQETKYIRLKNIIDRTVDLEYPVFDKGIYSLLFDEKFYNLYIKETQKRREVVLNNFNYLKKCFEKEVIIPLHLHSGFSTTLMLDSMKSKNELSDVEELAASHNIGIITESCFRKGKIQDDHYFVRIGLPMPNEIFKKGVDILKSYYDEKHKNFYLTNKHLLTKR